MKQTAVEFFEDKLYDFIHPEHRQEYFNILEQAKAMEKEQIEDAYEQRRRILDPDENGVIRLMSGEQYYNETYKK